MVPLAAAFSRVSHNGTGGNHILIYRDPELCGLSGFRVASSSRSELSQVVIHVPIDEDAPRPV